MAIALLVVYSGVMLVSAVDKVPGLLSRVMFLAVTMTRKLEPQYGWVGGIHRLNEHQVLTRMIFYAFISVCS